MEKDREKNVYQAPACMTVNLAVEGVICNGSPTQVNRYQFEVGENDGAI